MHASLAHVALAAATWISLAPGLELAELETIAGDSTPAIMRILRVDPARWTLHLGAAAREPGGRSLTARAWCEREGYVAAINAGMFATDYRTHVGWLVDGDYTNNAHVADYQSVAAWGARDPVDPPFRIFDLDGTIEHAEIAARYETVVQNLRLIRRPGENRWSRQDRRWSEAALAEDAEGRALFVFCRQPLAMADFNAALLALDIGVVAAQHLEGGPEAQLFIGVGGDEHVGSFETGFNEDDDNANAWPIPNVIGIRPRAGDEAVER